MKIYIRTNDSSKVVEIVDEYTARVIESDLSDVDFSLTNTAKAGAMDEARAAAKAEGLKLRKPSQVAVHA